MRKNLIYLVLCAIFLSFGIDVLAQEGGTASPKAKKERVQLTPEQRIDRKVERMQKRLMLSEADAKSFAPVYKEYLMALADTRAVCNKSRKASNNNLTDAQIKENLEKCLANNTKRAELKQTYYKKLSKVLSARQLQVVFCKGDKAKKQSGKMWMKGKNGKRGAKAQKRGYAMRRNCAFVDNCPMQK